MIPLRDQFKWIALAVCAMFGAGALSSVADNTTTGTKAVVPTSAVSAPSDNFKVFGDKNPLPAEDEPVQDTVIQADPAPTPDPAAPNSPAVTTNAKDVEIRSANPTRSKVSDSSDAESVPPRRPAQEKDDSGSESERGSSQSDWVSYEGKITGVRPMSDGTLVLTLRTKDGRTVEGKVSSWAGISVPAAGSNVVMAGRPIQSERNEAVRVMRINRMPGSNSPSGPPRRSR
ncbi:MAG: hypothetical protein K1X53_05140 [Candidatus Sumerlaeaceae bacterium]|nr:hypothetical protein [Candidatus Sumerlaeaceae bacterium]